MDPDRASKSGENRLAADESSLLLKLPVVAMALNGIVTGLMNVAVVISRP